MRISDYSRFINFWMLVYSIFYFGSTDSVPRNVYYIVYTADYSTALILAENELSSYLQGKFIEDNVSDEGNFDEPYDKFRYIVQSQKMQDEGPLESLNRLSLDVVWPSGRNERRLSLTTYLFNLVP